MTTWWSADMHFGHQRIIELAGRPFGSVEEMNETIIERWNATVAPGDTVWVLGDVAMESIGDSLAMCGQLAGRKLLVLGNHDRPFPGYSKTQEKQAMWAERYRTEGGFTDVLTGTGGADLPGIADPVLVSHFPYEGDSHDTDRYVQYRPVDKGGWLLHGHIHELWKIRGRQINVGVDAWAFYPVSSEQIASIILGSTSTP